MTSQTYATRRGHLMQERSADLERLLTPAEVAVMFRVDPKTVTRWARAGKLSSIRTLGGPPPVPRSRSRISAVASLDRGHRPPAQLVHALRHRNQAEQALPA